MDDLNTRFPAPEWPDDAPDPDNAVSFYNTETINKLVTMFNSLRAKVLSYIDDLSSSELSPVGNSPSHEWPDDAPDPDNEVPFYNTESIDYLKDRVTAIDYLKDRVIN